MDITQYTAGADSHDRLSTYQISKFSKQHGTTTRCLVHQSQQWTHAPPTFVHTNIIYKEDGRFFFACVKERFGQTNPISMDKITECRGREFYIDLIWPAYDNVLTIAVSGTQNLFLKTPNIMDVVLKDSEVVKRRILAEAQLCEKIRKSPHLNVVDYRGCLVEDGKIKGLWLKRYRETLYDRVNRSYDRDKILADIARGIEHLHSIGIVHGDLQPGNIMFDDNDNAVVIDLDSGHWTGELLAAADKRSTWFTKDTTLALLENDHYSIARVKDFLDGGMKKLINH
jgi:serine/threonine protein kinase